MTTLKITSVLLVVLTLTACQNIKSFVSQRDDGSLDYVAAQKLPPIQLPAKQPAREFKPLYHVPDIKGTPVVEEGAKRYKLPAPPKTLP